MPRALSVRRIAKRVVNVYDSDLRPYYPFNSQAEKDVNLNSFAAFFKTGGTLDSFYDAYLRPFTNSNGTLRSIMGRTLPLSSQALGPIGQGQPGAERLLLFRPGSGHQLHHGALRP